MSDKKGGLGGLFVNKKSSAAPAPGAAAKPKNVKQRWMMIGVGAVGFTLMASSLFGTKQEPVTVKPKDTGSVLVTPSGVKQGDWQSQAALDLRRAEAENAQLKAKVDGLAEQMATLKADQEKASKAPVVLPANIVAPPGMDKGAASGVIAPPAPPLPPANYTPPATGGALPLPAADLPSVPQEPKIFKPEAKAATASAPSGEAVKSTVRYTKNPYSGFLPAGAFAPVALLNGLDAGTSSATQSNPLPILLNITDHASLPGTAKYNIKSCFVLGTGYGDLSAERVYARISRMSCVDKRDRLVLSTDVTGYLVDSDGKIGLRGKVVDRQGAKLGKAVLAGFAQGLSGAFGQAQGVMTTTVAGATTSIGGDAALRAAGLNGAQSAAQQLAQFYLKEAQAIFPVITVDAGRTGSIVFTDNAQLTWSAGESQYVKSVTPDK